MVSTPLHVEGDKVESKGLVLRLEEVVGDLLREDIVKLLAGLGGQTH